MEASIGADLQAFGRNEFKADIQASGISEWCADTVCVRRGQALEVPAGKYKKRFYRGKRNRV